MKFLTLLLSLLFASNLYAEMQTSFCNAIDGGALSVQFDEAKQIVIVNKIPQTKVSIDEKSMRFWNDKYAYTFNRENGALMVYLGEEVVGVLECSFKKRLNAPVSQKVAHRKDKALRQIFPSCLHTFFDSDIRI